MYINGRKFLMLNISKMLFRSLGVVSLLLMAYSGYIKWMIKDLFIDPFILFSILLFVFMLIDGFRNIINKKSLFIASMLLLFFFWAFLSTTWGESQVYYLEKIQKSIVILFCFFIPFFILRTQERLKEFIYLFHLFTFLSALIILLIYILYGDIFIILNGEGVTEETGLPDYLALGILMASGFILALQKKGKVWFAYKTIIIIAILLLSPRGPLIALVLIVFFYYLKSFKFKLKWHMPIYTFIIGIIIIYFGAGVSERLFLRFDGFFDSTSSSYSSVGTRLELFSSAIEYFTDSPLFGIGYGSFGIKFNGIDDRIEPHNILFEIASQTGIIGISLFFIFSLSIYYYYILKKNRAGVIKGPLAYLTLYLIVQSLSTTYLIDSKTLFLWLSILICYLSQPIKPNANKLI